MLFSLPASGVALRARRFGNLSRKTMSDERRFLSRVTVREGPNLRVIPIGELILAAARDEGVRLTTRRGRYRLARTLASFSAALDPEHFLRVHRGFTINLDRLRHVEMYAKNSRRAILADGSRVLISRAGFVRLREFLS